MTDSPPRVLRVGVVFEGNLIDERLIPPAAPVTLGSAPEATLTVPVEMPTTPLFISRRGRYRMVIPEAAQGRVKTEAGVVDLAGFQASRGRRPLLEDADRGKVIIGKVTVLFQLVDAPPMPLRMLKGSFRPKLIDEDDPLFIGILSLCTAAAAVLMVHVSMIDPPPLAQFEMLDDYFDHITLTAPIEEPDLADVVEDVPEIAAVESPTAPPEEVVAEQVVEEVVPERSMTPEERAIADAVAYQNRRDEVVRQSALLEALLRNRGEGPEIFQTTDTIGEALIGAINGVSAIGDVAVAEDGARMGSDGRGRGDAGVDFEHHDGPAVVVDEGPESVVRERTISGEVRPEPPDIKDSDLRAQVSAAMAVLSPRIRSCYERVIKADPTLSGRLVLEVDLVGGRVSDAYVSGTIQSDALTACVESAAMRWQVPGADGVTLRLPFALSPVD
ncbi:MAG: hypothetical protein ACI8RZ_006598 [Myxococcota bacterium]|jgi:hypothetical protein